MRPRRETSRAHTCPRKKVFTGVAERGRTRERGCPDARSGVARSGVDWRKVFYRNRFRRFRADDSKGKGGADPSSMPPQQLADEGPKEKKPTRGWDGEKWVWV